MILPTGNTRTALGGFLLFNLPPASTFMGDEGALSVGLILGILSIQASHSGVGSWPARFAVPTERQKLAAGRVTFIRRVSMAGTVSVLSQSYRVGKRHRGLYLRLVVDTGRGRLTAYLNGRVLKRWPYKLLND